MFVMLQGTCAFIIILTFSITKLVIKIKNIVYKQSSRRDHYPIIAS